MNPIADVLNPFLWGLAALGAAAALLVGSRQGRGMRLAAAALLALAALGLLAALAVAAWLPRGAVVMHPDGSTDDPRALTAVVVGIAALCGLVPALRSLRLPPFGLLGVLLPGIGVAGLVAAVSYFAGLRAPMALAGILVAGVALGSGIALFARVRWGGLGALSLQMGASGLLLVAAVLSLHGARAETLEVGEGAAVDTLGQRVTLGVVQAPHDSVRNVQFLLASGGTSRSVWTSLVGRAGTGNRSVAGAPLFGGPLIVPMELREERPRAHDLVWLARGESTAAEASSVKFVGFRIVPGDTVRMLADLDVTTGGRTERVSPGMYATSAATTPFAATAAGLGPIAVGRMDADNGRVALVLPVPTAATVRRTATIGLHLRPALEAAWLGGALVALAFLLGFAAGPETARAPD